MSLCNRCGVNPRYHGRVCLRCNSADRLKRQAETAVEDVARLAAIEDTHQRCRSCGSGLYQVWDWAAEGSKPYHRRRWFCGSDCFEVWWVATFG